MASEIYTEQAIVQFTPGADPHIALEMVKSDLRKQHGEGFITADIAPYPYTKIPFSALEYSSPYYDTYLLIAYLWRGVVS